jgi:hypothetical protein
MMALAVAHKEVKELSITKSSGSLSDRISFSSRNILLMSVFWRIPLVQNTNSPKASAPE